MADSKELVMTVETREGTGKEAAKKLRTAGLIPAVVYGADKPAYPIVVDREAIIRVLKSETGENTIFLLKLKGTKQERRAMIKEIQTDPLTGDFVHLDFIRVTRGHKLNVTINVKLEGDSVGVRGGGVIDFASRELALEILPRHMIDSVTVDISELDIGDMITVSDLESMLPESGKFLEDSNRVVVKVDAPRAVEEEEEAEEVLEGDEDMVTDEQAEPEVIHGKGKDEAEGGE